MCLPSFNTKYADFARFLLAQLHLRSLAGKTSPKSIRTALKALPTGTDAYDLAYEQVIQSDLEYSGDLGTKRRISQEPKPIISNEP